MILDFVGNILPRNTIAITDLNRTDDWRSMGTDGDESPFCAVMGTVEG
jgi:hypothetical protein